MNREIRKYAFDPRECALAETLGSWTAYGWQHPIPLGSFFLDLQVQHHIPVMWWSVPAREEETRLYTFTAAITGPPGYTANLHYVGTFQDGDFVGHIFCWEEIPRLRAC